MEISAHFFAPGLTEFIFDDPLIFSLKLVEHVLNAGRSLSELSDEIPSYPYEELKFNCSDSIKFEVNKYLTDLLLLEGYKVETIDGVKIWLEDGWVLLRPSNTQPVIRMFVEARNSSALNQIKGEFEIYLNEAVEKLT